MISLIKTPSAIFLRWLALLLSVFTVSFASAQVSSTNTFRTVSLAGEIPEIFLNARGSPPITAAPRFINGPYRRAGNAMQFFTRDAETGTAKPLAIANIPSGIRQPLIVFRDVPQRLEDGTELPYSTVVIDDSSRGFPLNSIRFFNTANFPLAVSFSGQSPFVLQPGESNTISYGALASNTMRSVQLAGADASGRWQRISSGEVLLRRNNRHLLFLAPESIEPVAEFGPKELVLVLDAQGRIPRALPDEHDSDR